MSKGIVRHECSLIYGFICILLWVFIQCGKTARTSSQRLKIGMLNRLRSCFSCQCVKSRTSYLLYAGKFAQKTLIRCVSILVLLRDDPLLACLYLHVCENVEMWSGCFIRWCVFKPKFHCVSKIKSSTTSKILWRLSGQVKGPQSGGQTGVPLKQRIRPFLLLKVPKHKLLSVCYCASTSRPKFEYLNGQNPIRTMLGCSINKPF